MIGTKRLDQVDIDDLALSVGSARGAGDMPRDAAPTLGTGLEQWLAPAVGSSAETLLVLGSAAFWCGHGSRWLRRLIVGINRVESGPRIGCVLRGGAVYSIIGGLVHC